LNELDHAAHDQVLLLVVHFCLKECSLELYYYFSTLASNKLKIKIGLQRRQKLDAIYDMLCCHQMIHQSLTQIKK